MTRLQCWQRGHFLTVSLNTGGAEHHTNDAQNYYNVMDMYNDTCSAYTEFMGHTVRTDWKIRQEFRFVGISLWLKHADYWCLYLLKYSSSNLIHVPTHVGFNSIVSLGYRLQFNRLTHAHNCMSVYSRLSSSVICSGGPKYLDNASSSFWAYMWRGHWYHQYWSETLRHTIWKWYVYHCTVFQLVTAYYQWF